MPPNTADDRTLLDEFNRLGEALGPFVFGILTDTLSITEQLEVDSGGWVDSGAGGTAGSGAEGSGWGCCTGRGW